MKRKLFLQGIFIFLISLLIAVLVTACTIGVFFAVRDIPVMNGKLTSDTAVIKGGEIKYSSMELSTVDEQKLLMSAKTPSGALTIRGIDYLLSKRTFPDGVELIGLTPDIDYDRAYKMIILYTLIVFVTVYLIVLAMVQKKNEKEIDIPLLELKKQTQLLASGDLDINIPDNGWEEINRLAKEIESLRIRLKKEVYINKKAVENRKFLISSMSHDLRTPITALRGYLCGILDGVAGTKEKQDMYIKKSLEKTDLINQMIGDLLLYSKLDLNQVEFKLQTIDVAEYLTAFVEDARVVFEGQNKKISFENKTQASYGINIDIQQMDRVMGNVVSNALKYIPEEMGEVQVILRENISSVIIEVLDNGTGIAEEDISKIFDRFYRCEKSRQIKGSSGLGLAISKQIIENMDGRIWAVSKSGEGTSILISLKKQLIKRADYEKNSDN